MLYTLTVVREKVEGYDACAGHGDAPSTENYKIRNSTDVYNLLRDQARSWDREHFVVIPLTAKNEVIGLHTVSIGSLSASVVHPREVFKVAILENAAAVIVAHNHPSGDPTPSSADRSTTKRMADAGTTLGIPVLDHVVIADDEKFYSFADNGDAL